MPYRKGLRQGERGVTEESCRAVQREFQRVLQRKVVQRVVRLSGFFCKNFFQISCFHDFLNMILDILIYLTYLSLLGKLLI